MGLRRLLTRQPSTEDSLEHFAELGRERAPTRPFAEPATESAADPILPVIVEKKPESLGVPVVRRQVSPPPLYIWRSQRSREAFPDLFNMKF